jgi:tRNA threonylcarbamoyladenosine biosynthesis protein TsaB
MLVLALDTTTRAGSVALIRDGEVLDVHVGDAALTHAARLPGDLLEVLRRRGLDLADVDLFAVAAGPGSFTGLRIGIAAIQGLAFATRRPVVGVSALEALARGADDRAPLVGAWMDAQRGEVYAQLYGQGATLERPVLRPAAVGRPAVILDAWATDLAPDGARFLFVGDGALAHRAAIDDRWPGARVASTVPPLAPTIALLAAHRAAHGEAGPPHAVKPLYVRRPDAELARDRQRAAAGDPAPSGATNASIRDAASSDE